MNTGTRVVALIKEFFNLRAALSYSLSGVMMNEGQRLGGGPVAHRAPLHDWLTGSSDRFPN